ncbi:MAG: rare lipoprotein precursor [Ramlibacter sp.]|nr:rare lipoprotein precursor [Ramlibacter sp.]
MLLAGAMQVAWASPAADPPEAIDEPVPLVQLLAAAAAAAAAADHHGEASWYGPGFHGRRTASGERFDKQALTAAHRSLPFGTRVRVEDTQTGRTVEVRINDRGPHVHRSRIIDLSEAAGQILGLGRKIGIANVRLTILAREPH